MSTVTKRKRENSADDMKAVTKRSNGCEASEENPLTGILILNDDCFRKIFMDLNAKQLLNVIQAHDRFKFASEEVFKQKYCRFPVLVSNILDTYVNTNISVHELSYSIQILKHFGHLISKLCIRFKFGNIDTLLDAVAANCDNLLELELKQEGDRIRKPWTNTARSSIKRMKSFLNDLNIQFPKLSHLNLNYSIASTACPYSDALIHSIPSLSSFAFRVAVAGRLFTEAKLTQFFGMNQQLERLECTVDQWELYDTEDAWHISSDFIRCLDESLPMLKCVEINRVSNGALRTPETFPIRFRNLKELTFHCFLEFDADPDVGFMSFLSDSVEVLKLSIFDPNIHRFLQNITQFKNLKVLHLEYPVQIVSPNLNAITMELTVWGQHGIKQLMNNNPNLTEIKLSHHPQDSGTSTLEDIYENMTTYMADDGSRWTVTDEFFESYTFRKVLN